MPAIRASARSASPPRKSPLVHRLNPEIVAQNIVNYFLAMDKEFKKLLAPIGNSSLPVGRSDALVATDKAIADRLKIQYVC